MAIKTIPYKGQELLLVTYDLVFKALLTSDGDLELLASLLSCILELKISAEDITVTNTELPRTHVGDKLSSVDVRVKLSDGKHINAEIQVQDEHNMESRSVYYLSRLYVEQMVSGMDYIDIQPTISIIILDYPLLDYKEYHNKYRLKNTRNNDELTDVFEINFLELKKVRRKNKNSMKDLWMLFLKAEKEEELEMLANENPIMEKAINKLVYISADEKVRYELDMREKAELDYHSAMKSNYRKGEEKGEAKGKKEMIIEMKNDGLSEERIAKIAKLPVEKIRGILSAE